MPPLNGLMRGAMTHYRAIPGKTVATAMVNECVAFTESANPKVNVYTYDNIVKMADVTPI